MDFQKDFKSNVEKEAYLKALVTIAMADEVIKKEEKEFIEAQATLLGVDSSLIWNNDNRPRIDELSTLELSLKTKKAVIADCILLGYCDGEFDSSEKEILYNYANALNIEKAYVDDIEKWINDFKEIQERAVILFQ